MQAFHHLFAHSNSESWSALRHLAHLFAESWSKITR